MGYDVSLIWLRNSWAGSQLKRFVSESQQNPCTADSMRLVKLRRE